MGKSDLFVAFADHLHMFAAGAFLAGQRSSAGIPNTVAIGEFTL
jgi:hypothetical protein